MIAASGKTLLRAEDATSATAEDWRIVPGAPTGRCPTAVEAVGSGLVLEETWVTMITSYRTMKVN